MFGENHPMLSGQQETRWVFSWKKVLMNQHGFKWVENTLGFFVLPLHLCMFEIFHHKCFFKWISQTRYWAEEARHKKVHTHYRIPCIKLKKRKQAKPIKYMRNWESGYPWWRQKMNGGSTWVFWEVLGMSFFLMWTMVARVCSFWENYFELYTYYVL